MRCPFFNEFIFFFCFQTFSVVEISYIMTQLFLFSLYYIKLEKLDLRYTC